MTAIHVQAKEQSSGAAWVLVLVLLLIASSMVYYNVSRKRTPEKKLLKQPDAASQFRPQAQPDIRERPRQKIQIVYMRTV